MTTPSFLKLTVGLAVGLFVLELAVAGFTMPGDVLAGVAVGGGLGTINLAVLSWLCVKVLRATERRWRYAFLMGAKFVLLIGAVWLAVRYVPMDVIGFVAGLSASGLAIVAATSWVAWRGVELEI